jgi:D-alanyl-D-alanine carboxypeptidase/D-alanyl-D-alanine-endopeptidase (penicillin-binding protein 4)
MIHQEYLEEKTLQYLPTGGESGTIKNFYKADKPYVFAKTGTLSNSVCLSGYLITKKGKKLIFSFMHNNYVIPSSELKKEMERILWQIHTSY